MDGYTRIPVYFRGSTNNLSDTVPELFLQAVEKYGLPSRVRSDKGGENVGVSMLLLQHPDRGPGRGGMIAGCSVHNQWIEGLWRDLLDCVIYVYYHLFDQLEDCGK